MNAHDLLTAWGDFVREYSEDLNVTAHELLGALSNELNTRVQQSGHSDTTLHHVDVISRAYPHAILVSAIVKDRGILSIDQRANIVMRYVYRYEPRDIAKCGGVDVEVVYKSLEKGKRRVKKAWQSVRRTAHKETDLGKLARLAIEREMLALA